MKQVAPPLRDAILQDRKSGLKDNRLYWFLREIGLEHSHILGMIDIESNRDDNSSNG